MYQWLQRLFLELARAGAQLAHPALPFDLVNCRYHHWMFDTQGESGFDTSALDGDLSPSAAEAHRSPWAIDGAGQRPPRSVADQRSNRL